MTRHESLVESRVATLSLSLDEAEALQRMGRGLASSKTWWGAAAADTPASERSVISVQPASNQKWRVRVVDAVGHISVGDLAISIEPKIPIPHLFRILEGGIGVPRTLNERTTMSNGNELWPLLAEWYVHRCEKLLRSDLVRDYSPTSSELRVVRGRVDPNRSARAFLAGRIELHCEFDEFETDTAANRVLKAAATVVASGSSLLRPLRRRAKSVLSRMDGVGEFSRADLVATVDRRMAHYRDALSLAAQILQSKSRSLGHGDSQAWAFLMRTPDVVESGIRSLLASRLSPAHSVEKRGITLSGSSMTINPDLVFDGGRAVGDVKYKNGGASWSRPDLYQSIAFAEAFESAESAIIDFVDGAAVRSPVIVGAKTIHHFLWRTDISPEAAVESLTMSVGQWLERLAVSRAA